MEEIIKWSTGNPGALTFLMSVFATTEASLGEAVIIQKKLEKCKTLRGTNIYVLWSDLCDKDVLKVVKLCNSCPDEILEDACSRQDYSGREIIAEYLKE